MTEREHPPKRVEQAVQQEGGYFRSLLEISPTAIVTVDRDASVSSWNPAAERLFGYTQEEALGRNIDELVAGSDELHDEAVRMSEEAARHGIRLTTRRARKDGTLVDVDLRAAPIVVGGETVGMFALYHDVGELQRQKQYFASLVEMSPTAIVTVDVDATVTSWNPAAERLFGYAREEAIGRHIDDLVALSEEVHEEAGGVNRDAARGEVHLITRRTRKDGTLVDVDLRAAPIVVGGETVGMFALYHDISELQRQKQYFASLVDLSPTAVAIVDAEGTVRLWNPAAEKLFGYTREEAVGRNIDDLVANAEELRAEAEGYTSDASTGYVHASARRTRKDGSLVDVDLLAAPVRIAGDTVGAYAIYHDISDLVKARREAEAATQAKSAFLATMSHEIRTPMNAVIGMAGLLRDTDLTPEQREFADVIANSGDALLAIIDEILDFSKIEAGRLDLESRPFDLRECLEAALDVVSPRAAEKGLDLAYLLDEEAPPAIVADVTRLRQILINLLSNAVKFTEAGEVVVSLEAKPLDAGRHELHVAVRDTGIGIPADRIDRLFESFSQVDASTRRRYGGTGLGLAISKRLSEMMGGTMWAHSQVGKGSTFHFTIVAEAASSPAHPYDSHEEPQLAGKRVLVVDDNETNRTILVRYAEAWGMLPRACASPAEALAWIERGDRFDLGLLDLQMPEMDGIALGAAIRRRSTLPLVLLTSLGQGRQDEEAGVDFAARLTKPIKASQLYETLVSVFAREPTQTPAPAARREAPAAPQALRILLAEDNVVNQRLALALLNRLGYSADVAANGLEALAVLERERYDVVLMDVEMPEMDGLEATRRIRARRPGAEGPRIVALTANAMQGDREMCLAAGMDDYLAKPIRPKELAEALARSAPSTQLASEGALDPAALAQLEQTLDDRHFFAELVATFLAEAPALLGALGEGVEAGDAEAVRRAAHTLKSNARTFGALALAESAQELEAAAREGRLEQVGGRVEAIEAEYERAKVALEATRREVT